MHASMVAVAWSEAFAEDMYVFADEQARSVDTLIHENGAAQWEINFNHGDPLDMADQVFVFKRTVRETAQRHGMYATFMAKPMQKEPGSALHIHQSMLSVETGENIFNDEEGEPKAERMNYIAGIQSYTQDRLGYHAPNGH